jgi:hypothetical protein
VRSGFECARRLQQRIEKFASPVVFVHMPFCGSLVYKQFHGFVGKLLTRLNDGRTLTRLCSSCSRKDYAVGALICNKKGQRRAVALWRTAIMSLRGGSIACCFRRLCPAVYPVSGVLSESTSGSCSLLPAPEATCRESAMNIAAGMRDRSRCRCLQHPAGPAGNSNT